MPDPKAWSHEAMVAYWELPAADRAAPEADAERHWLAIPWEERPTSAELVDCIRAWRADLLRINAGRPSDKPQMVRYLGNWIKDRSYAGFLDEVRKTPKRVAAKVVKAKADYSTLGETVIEKLLASGFEQGELDWFSGAVVGPEPDNVIYVTTPFRQEQITQKFIRRLRTALGDDVHVELMEPRAA